MVLVPTATQALLGLLLLQLLVDVAVMLEVKRDSLEDQVVEVVVITLALVVLAVLVHQDRVTTEEAV